LGGYNNGKNRAGPILTVSLKPGQYKNGKNRATPIFNGKIRAGAFFQWWIVENEMDGTVLGNGFCKMLVLPRIPLTDAW
jgi:hypothetical protein